MRKLLFTILLLLVCSPLYARTATWDGGGGNNLASTAANWDGPDTAPVTGDAVVFDGTSANACTWDLGAAVDLASINTTGYAGLVTLSSTLKVSGNITWANGTFAHGNQIVQFDATGTITGTDSYYDGAVTSTAGATLTLANDVTFVRNFDWANGAGQNTINGNKIYVGGNFSHTTTGTNRELGTTTVELNGTGTWSNAATGVDHRVPVIINTAGTITLSGTLARGNSGVTSITFTAGTVDAGTSVLLVKAPDAFNTNGITWYDVTVDEGMTNSSNLSLSHNLLVESSGSMAMGANTVTVGGNFTNSRVTGNIFTGTGTVILTGTGAIDGSTNFYSLTINGTYTLDDADTFTTNAGGTFSGTGALSSDDASNRVTLTVNGTVDGAFSAAGTRIDSSAGNAVNTIGVVMDCLNWNSTNMNVLYDAVMYDALIYSAAGTTVYDSVLTDTILY